MSNSDLYIHATYMYPPHKNMHTHIKCAATRHAHIMQRERKGGKAWGLVELCSVNAL